ncbi:N-acetylmuramic acid 6-phosphate etherase-like isoform X3 [Artemia franciscana]
MNYTEASSKYNDLELKTTRELLESINEEDKTVALAVEKAISQIEALIESIVERMKHNGRLFYIGAGTSGRLGIVDASECPPTYGVPHGLVVGLIAGGDSAIRRAVEFAEDDPEQGWKDLQAHNINSTDTVIGIAASGRTPYVVGAVQKAKSNRINTGCITCNLQTALAKSCDYPIEVIVGPEFVSGSSRMKAGTAQKMVLNMISTSVMIRLGRIKGNRMVDMSLSNAKLVNRGIRMVQELLGIEEDEAKELIDKHRNVRNVLNASRS